jgi:hypothetical protein
MSDVSYPETEVHETINPVTGLKQQARKILATPVRAYIFDGRQRYGGGLQGFPSIVGENLSEPKTEARHPTGQTRTY